MASPKKSSSLPSSVAKSSATKTPIPRPSSQPTVSSKPVNRSRAGSLDKHGPSKSSSQPTKSSKYSAADRDKERDRYASRPVTSASGAAKKRPRSESRSESPPPKRRATSMEEEDLPGDLSSTIWSIFGRKRDRYVGMDVFSDDEDMEADARVLEREEKFRSVVPAHREMLGSLIIWLSSSVPVLRRGRIWKPSKKIDDVKRRNEGAKRRRNVANVERITLLVPPIRTLSRDRSHQLGLNSWSRTSISQTLHQDYLFIIESDFSTFHLRF